MTTSVLVLGAGFGGLELSTHLSEELGDQVEITLIDQADNFVFGFSKLDVMFGKREIDAVRMRYEDITTWEPSEIARAGVVRTFQDVRLFTALTVFENVEAAAVSTGATRREARALSWEILERVGLEQRARGMAAALPHGEQRLLAVARALAARPLFLLLDEPAAGLDEGESDELVGALAAIRDAFGVGLLVIEHDMRVIMKLSESIQVLDDGKTIALGTPAEIRTDPAVLSAYLGAREADAPSS